MHALLLKRLYRRIEALSYLDWGLTSDYDAAATQGRASRGAGVSPRTDRADGPRGLGGNTRGSEGYGELTTGSVQRLCALLHSLREVVLTRLRPEGWARAWDLTSESALVDVGSGFGKVVMHVAVELKVRRSVGIECVISRHEIAAHALQEVRSEILLDAKLAQSLRSPQPANTGGGSSHLANGAGVSSKPANGGGNSSKQADGGGHIPQSASAGGGSSHLAIGGGDVTSDSKLCSIDAGASTAALVGPAPPAPAGATGASPPSTASLPAKRKACGSPGGPDVLCESSGGGEADAFSAEAERAVAHSEPEDPFEGVYFHFGDATLGSHLDFSHVYAFDRVFSPATLGALARVLQASPFLVLISYRTAAEWWQQGLSAVQPVAKIRVHTTGKETMTAYIYINMRYAPE